MAYVPRRRQSSPHGGPRSRAAGSRRDIAPLGTRRRGSGALHSGIASRGRGPWTRHHQCVASGGARSDPRGDWSVAYVPRRRQSSPHGGPRSRAAGSRRDIASTLGTRRRTSGALHSGIASRGRGPWTRHDQCVASGDTRGPIRGEMVRGVCPAPAPIIPAWRAALPRGRVQAGHRKQPRNTAPRERRPPFGDRIPRAGTLDAPRPVRCLRWRARSDPRGDGPWRTSRAGASHPRMEGRAPARPGPGGTSQAPSEHSAAGAAPSIRGSHPPGGDPGRAMTSALPAVARAVRSAGRLVRGVHPAPAPIIPAWRAALPRGRVQAGHRKHPRNTAPRERRPPFGDRIPRAGTLDAPPPVRCQRWRAVRSAGRWSAAYVPRRRQSSPHGGPRSRAAGSRRDITSTLGTQRRGSGALHSGIASPGRGPWTRHDKCVATRVRPG